MILENHLVSAVMVSYNRKEDVREGLLRLLNQKYPALEIIVVENGSTDGTAEMVQREFRTVRLINLQENTGVSAYNVGFKHSAGKYILILDDDSFPEEGAIEKMVEKFEQDPLLGVAAFDVRDYYNYRETTGKVDDKTEKEETLSNNYIMSFNGAGAGLRKEIIDAIGGYPEEFFLYFNETDLALRVWNLGFKVKFFPDLVSYHKNSPSNRESTRAPFYYTRNLFWVLWKNYPQTLMWKNTFKLIYHCLYYSIEQGTGVYLKSFVDAVGGLRYILKKRMPVKKEVAKNMRIHMTSPFTMYR
ncbi:MAG: glycosyltransferase family 2 protein [Nitrospirae bacterium YQR-1]